MRRPPVLPALTALMAATVLFALAGYQVTSETAALRLLGRLSAALIEADRWLPEHRDDLDLIARDRPEGMVRVPDLPVPVTLPARQVIDADDGAGRALVLSAMSRALYEEGNDAFRDPQGLRRAPGLEQPAYWTVLLLSDGVHALWQAALPIALLVLVAFSASVLLSGRSLPMAIAGGAAIAVLGSLGVWMLAGAAGGAFSSPVDQEVVLILRDGAWSGVRNAFAVLAASLGLLLVFHLQESLRLPLSRSSPPDAPSV